MTVDPDLEDTWPTVELPSVADDAVTSMSGVDVAAWAAGSEVGRVRTSNEDRWAEIDGRVFLVVDGMGGHAGGELAAESSVDALARPPTAAWRSWVSAANEVVRERTMAAGCPDAGATVVLVAISACRATIVNVGDSRAYRCREGRLEQLTEDHTVRGELLAAGIDADLHADRRVAAHLTSYLGIDPHRLRIDVIDVPLQPGDRLLLSTDGVHDRVPMHELSRIVPSGSAKGVVTDLLAAADQAGGHDNATAVVIDLQ